MVCCADPKVKEGGMPSGGSDINNIPRVGSAWKLQRQTLKGGQIVHSEPWRTEENHMSEWLEIINRFVPANGTFWDPTCGSMTSGLAALRLGRRCFLSDKDPDIIDAAEWRLKYYHSWIADKYPTNLTGEPAPHDGLNHYRFHQVFLPDKNNPGRVQTLPHNGTAPRQFPVYGSTDFETYCASAGVKVMQSLIPNSDKGLFLVAPKRVGDPWDVDAKEQVLRIPYLGRYGHSAKGNRALLVQSPIRSIESRPVYLIGFPGCPATFINDPLVFYTPCSFLCVSFSFFLFFFFFCHYTINRTNKTETLYSTTKRDVRSRGELQRPHSTTVKSCRAIGSTWRTKTTSW